MSNPNTEEAIMNARKYRLLAVTLALTSVTVLATPRDDSLAGYAGADVYQRQASYQPLAPR